MTYKDELNNTLSTFLSKFTPGLSKQSKPRKSTKSALALDESYINKEKEVDLDIA